MNASDPDEKGKGGEKVSLTVKQAKNRDIGRNLIRIDSECMNKLGIKNFDIVSLKGKKVTAGIACPSYPEDEGLNIVRLDSRLRENAGTSIDDTVYLKKTEPKTARSIKLKPKDTKIRSNPRFVSFVKAKINNYPVTIGDVLIVPIGISKEITFKVIKLSPEGTCIIKNQTELSISGTFIGEDKLAEKEIEVKSKAFKVQLEGLRETRTALENGASGYEIAEMIELYEKKLKKIQNEWNEQSSNDYEPKLPLLFPNFLGNHLRPINFIKHMGNHSINDDGFREVSNTFKLKKHEQETERVLGYLEFKKNQKT